MINAALSILTKAVRCVNTKGVGRPSKCGAAFAWPAASMMITLFLLAEAASATGTPCAAAPPEDAALYRYRRSDDPITDVVVSVPESDAPAISPRLFSSFLEHLGGTIYNGVWANVVQNPRFGADKRGRLANWRLQTGAAWLKDDPKTPGISLPEGASASQLVNLPLHRQRRYEGSVRAQSLSGNPATIAISLRRSDKPTVIAAIRMDISHGGSSENRFSLTAPEHALDRAESCELRIETQNGSAAIEMIELFPADHVDGVDPDVLKAAKDLHCELLRWPGGNFVSGYHWRNGIGPRIDRPTVPNPAWNGLETHHFGTDEFMAFCRRIGAKPHICVNAGNGSPEEAAAWVEYCNGGLETPMGRLRAKNGHRGPYNVRVWEIGNELYGSWQIGFTDAAENAKRYERFRDAMLKADPTIEIIATGKGDEYTGKGLERVHDWNASLLERALTPVAHAPNYLSLHPIVPLPSSLNSRCSYDEVYASAMAHPQWWSDTFIPALKKQVTARGGKKTGLKIAATEWGLIVGGPNWLRYPNHDVQSGAVYAALFFHAMFRRADFVGIANVTALMHGGGIKRPNSVVYRDAMYFVEQMYGLARPSRLLPVQVSGPGYDVPERMILPAVKDVPWLDVLAAEGNGSRWLFVVNRDKESRRTAKFTFQSVLGGAVLTSLAAPPQQGNSLSNPDRVRPVVTRIQISGKTLAWDFAPCSVNVIRLR